LNIDERSRCHSCSAPFGGQHAVNCLSMANGIESAPALSKQEGGDHYKKLAIQPIEYINQNGLGFCEGNVVKYVTRWRDKAGIEDLKKAKHYVELLIDFETRKTDST